MGIVLASASPRRRELLEMLGVKSLKIIPAEAPETAPEGEPGEIVRQIALQKARLVAQSCGRGDLVIAADTLVFLEGGALGKPRDQKEAIAMLRRLSGACHSVYTGVAIVRGDMENTFSERTDVYFRELTDEEIKAYVLTGEPMDKAGAYGAQGRGAAFIRRIEGDFFNVVGLPVCRLVTELRCMGFELATGGGDGARRPEE